MSYYKNRQKERDETNKEFQNFYNIYIEKKVVTTPFLDCFRVEFLRMGVFDAQNCVLQKNSFEEVAISFLESIDKNKIKIIKTINKLLETEEKNYIVKDNLYEHYASGYESVKEEAICQNYQKLKQLKKL